MGEQSPGADDSSSFGRHHAWLPDRCLPSIAPPNTYCGSSVTTHGLISPRTERTPARTHKHTLI